MNTSSPMMIVQRKRPWWQRRTLVIGIFLVVIILTGGAGTWYLSQGYEKDLQAKSQDQAGIRVTIQSGMDGQQIGVLLQDKGVIRSAKSFTKYLKKTNNNNLHAGTYLLAPSMPVAEIVEILAEGRVDSYKMTLVPGQTLTEITASLQKAGFEKNKLDIALAKKYTHKLLADKPADADLEGYILPETYQLTSEVSSEQFLTHSFDIFYAQLETRKLIAGLKAQGLNLHQAFTLASIVQKEADKKDDQRKVAQVFLSRLKIDMPLGSDVTFMYASEKAGVADDLNIDSPYNTRRYKGLPPGPISNFTLTALEAVAYPSNTDYLFFVAGDDGTVHYSHTQAEHEALTRQYCTTLCQ